MFMELSELHIIHEPFPVLVFNNVFPEALLRAVHASWPHPEWDNWFRYNDENSDQYGSKNGRECPPAALTVLDQLSIFPLHEYLGPLKLPKCDFFPDLSYHAGGLHCIRRGGKLNCHIDALQHPIKPWTRVVNLLLYVTPDWNISWGGELNLHREDQSIQDNLIPVFNRLVVFCPTNTALHSVSPVHDNERARCSLATFFWKNAPVHMSERFSYFARRLWEVVGAPKILKDTISAALAITTADKISDERIKTRLEICGSCKYVNIVDTNTLACGICECKVMKKHLLLNLALYEEDTHTPKLWGCKFPGGSKWEKYGV
jgi:hypothetical protein